MNDVERHETNEPTGRTGTPDELEIDTADDGTLRWEVEFVRRRWQEPEGGRRRDQRRHHAVSRRCAADVARVRV